MVLMTHNTDVADSWEREGEDPGFFYQFSPDGYALGIDVHALRDDALGQCFVSSSLREFGSRMLAILHQCNGSSVRLAAAARLRDRTPCAKIGIPMQFINGFITVAVLLLAFTAYAQTPGGNAAARALKNPVASTPASITAGAAAYKKYCAFCHGADAKGNGPLAPKDSNPPDLTDATWAHGSTDGEIFTVIVNGTGPDSKMVGFKGKMPDAGRLAHRQLPAQPRTEDPRTLSRRVPCASPRVSS